MLYKNKITNSILFFLRYSTQKKRNISKRKSNTFMLHTGRVGSTVIADLLNQHPEIHWDGEFYPMQQKNFLKFIHKDSVKQLEIRMNQKGHAHYGYELKCPSFELYGKKKINMNLKDYINELSKLNITNYILLIRKNYLKQIVSFINARETKIHHLNQTSEFKRMVHININKCVWFKKEMHLLKHFEYLDEHYQNISNYLKDKRLLCLNYEDDVLKDPKKAYYKIIQYLNIKSFEPKIHLKKTNPFPLSEIIDNYTDVEKALKKTKYEWMLND